MAEEQTAELDRLRQMTRDLVALSTLPAIWANLDPKGVIDSLAGVLLNSRQLDLVYVRLANRDEPGVVDTLRTSCPNVAPADLVAARSALDAQFGSGAHPPAGMSDPFGKGSLRVHCIPFGIAGDIGMMVTGSARPDFPSADDRLLLGVGANQAAVVLQRLWTELALKRSEKRFLDMADVAPAMLWVTETDGSCSFLSRGWYEFTGQVADEGLGFGWLKAIHPDDMDAASKAFMSANERKTEFIPARSGGW